MNRADILKYINEKVQQMHGHIQISESSKILGNNNDLNFSSLEVVGLIIQIEEHYNIEIEYKIETVGEIIDMIVGDKKDG